MKKIILLLMFMLVLLMSSTKAQTDNPILPRIYEDGYSIDEIEEFALRSTEYSSNYRRVLLRMINRGLKESGEYLNINGGQPLTSSHISWIYDHVVRDPRGYLPAGYSNTFKKGNDVATTKGKTDYFGPLDRFVFGSCVVNLDKPSCVNLLGDLGIFEPPNRTNWTSQQQDPTLQRSEQQQVSSQTTEQSNTAFVAPKTVSEMMMAKVPEEQTSDLFLPKNKFNWKPVLVVGGVGLAIGTGALLYALLAKKESSNPAAPFVPVDPNGGPVGP